MVGITKLRIKFGREGCIKTFPGNTKKIEKIDESKKRGREEQEEVQANKKRKQNRVLSSQFLTLVKFLKGHEYGWLFGEPVDPAMLKIPDYFSVISKPMDLGTIKSKVLKNAYSTADEFAADVRLTFTNAMLYNPPENLVHRMAKALEKSFEVRWESLMRKKISELPLTKQDCLVKNNSGSQASESEPPSNESIGSKNDKAGCVSSLLEEISMGNELKTPLPAMPPLPPEKALRAATLKGQFAETIVRAKHRNLLNQCNKSDLIRIQIEKEQMERTQREEKARIEAEIAAAKLAVRMRAEAELNQKRQRERLKLEKMQKVVDFEENNYLKFNEEMLNLCGTFDLTRTLPELGLFLKDDDDWDEIDSENDLEEGEIS